MTHTSLTQRRGQSLVALLIFVAVAAVVTTFSVNVVIVNSLSSTRVEQSSHAWELAESGAEEALLRLLRDPNYNGGILTVGTNRVTVTVTGDITKTIVSQATADTYLRTIKVIATVVNTIVSPTTWREIF